MHLAVSGDRHIIKLKGVELSGTSKKMIIERGIISIQDFFINKAFHTHELKDKIILTVTHQMIRAALHIDNAGVQHNDAHLRNWMIGLDGNLKLLDFGEATYRNNPENPAYGLKKDCCFDEDAPLSDLYEETHTVGVINQFISMLSITPGELLEHLSRIKSMEQMIADPSTSMQQKSIYHTEIRSVLESLLNLQSSVWQSPCGENMIITPKQMKEIAVGITS